MEPIFAPPAGAKRVVPLGIKPRIKMHSKRSCFKQRGHVEKVVEKENVQLKQQLYTVYIAVLLQVPKGMPC